MRRVLITGANGFVGLCLCNQMHQHDLCYIRAAVRRPSDQLPAGVDMVTLGAINGETDWTKALYDVDVVVHLAARVHVLRDKAANPLVEFRNVNVDGGLNLARQAAAAGVCRFIFISSIKVNGELTTRGTAFTEDDMPAPVDPYGISKYEAEQGLRQLSSNSGMNVVIIRPPLIYGAGVKANFNSMMCWLNRGIPLPFGAIHNKRSFLSLDNFVDLIITCLEHPSAVGQTFLASDGEDLSTTELLLRMAHALGKPARLMPIPVSLLKAGAALLGRRDIAQRLCGSLQVDISKARTMLGWNPPISVDEGLCQTAEQFLHETTL